MAVASGGQAGGPHGGEGVKSGAVRDGDNAARRPQARRSRLKIHGDRAGLPGPLVAGPGTLMAALKRERLPWSGT